MNALPCEPLQEECIEKHRKGWGHLIPASTKEQKKRNIGFYGEIVSDVFNAF